MDIRPTSAFLVGGLTGILLTHQFLGARGSASPPGSEVAPEAQALHLGRFVATRGRFLSLDGEEVPFPSSETGGLGSVLLRVSDGCVDCELILRSFLAVQPTGRSDVASLIVIVGNVDGFPRAWLDSALSSLRFTEDGAASPEWPPRVRVVTASESDLQALGLRGPASWMRLNGRGELVARGEGPF
jgi:hypothetical protein